MKAKHPIKLASPASKLRDCYRIALRLYPGDLFECKECKTQVVHAMAPIYNANALLDPTAIRMKQANEL